jgi:hypothetical protein
LGFWFCSSFDGPSQKNKKEKQIAHLHRPLTSCFFHHFDPNELSSLSLSTNHPLPPSSNSSINEPINQLPRRGGEENLAQRLLHGRAAKV